MNESQLTTELTKLREDIAHVKLRVAVMNEKQDTLISANVDRKEAIEKIVADVQVLKEARQQQLGERTIMIAVAVFIGGILQSLASAFFAKH